MLVICDGMPRSASTWSFNVVLALLRCEQPSEVHCGYDDDIAHFLESVPATAVHAVVKCHQLDVHGRELAQSGVAKLIYTWRDPADAVVSCMRMFGYEFQGALAVIDSSLELRHFHRRQRAALIVDYEQIVTASNEAIQRIANYLELETCPDAIQAIAEQTSLERVKEHVESLADSTRVVSNGVHEYDPETHFHRRHIRDGSVGYGRKILTAEQAERVEDLRQKHGLTRTAPV